MLEFVRQQNNNGYCTLYALNNIIQCSPFLFDRRPYTVSDMVNACDQVFPTPRERCNEKNGGFTLGATQWLLSNHPFSKDRGLIHSYFTFINKDLFTKETAVLDLDKKLITIGFICVIQYKTSPRLHGIAIINLQPLTSTNVQYVLVDSNANFVVLIKSHENLLNSLESAYNITRNYTDESGVSHTISSILVVKKTINDVTQEELKSLHEESEEPLEAGSSYYFFTKK